MATLPQNTLLSPHTLLRPWAQQLLPVMCLLTCPQCPHEAGIHLPCPIMLLLIMDLCHLLEATCTTLAMLKRTLSPIPDDTGMPENKCSRTGSLSHNAMSGSGGRWMPIPSACTSSAPFCPQPTSHSLKTHLPPHHPNPYPPSPPLPAVLPHPQPIGAGLSSLSNSGLGPINLPLITTGTLSQCPLQLPLPLLIRGKLIASVQYPFVALKITQGYTFISLSAFTLDNNFSFTLSKKLSECLLICNIVSSSSFFQLIDVMLSSLNRGGSGSIFL
jgi:hypothetical protein